PSPPPPAVPCCRPRRRDGRGDRGGAHCSAEVRVVIQLVPYNGAVPPADWLEHVGAEPTFNDSRLFPREVGTCPGAYHLPAARCWAVAHRESSDTLWLLASREDLHAARSAEWASGGRVRFWWVR